MGGTEAAAISSVTPGCHSCGAACSSGSGLAVMQPINLGSGEDPILDLDRCGALSRLGQIVQRDHCIAQRRAINQYVAVYESRWLAYVGIDFIFFAAHVLPHFLRISDLGRVPDLIGTVGWTNVRGTNPCGIGQAGSDVGIGQECVLDSQALN